MCGACGVLNGGPDWVDRVGNPEGVSHRPDLTRTAERQRRIALANLLLKPRRLLLSDLGSGLILRGPTGATEIVEVLAHVWTAADRIAPPGIDPLDIEQIESFESAQIEP
jgi:hypothetical protein